MGTQQLPLCWNSHKTEILTTFQRLLVEESFVDVTLACEGITLKAHKTILSACSPFFHDLFLENPCKHPIVIMKDIKYRDLKGIIDFMYHGGINVAPDQLSDFLKAAEALKVKGLSEHPSMSIDLNKQLKMQQKSPHKTKHPSSHLQNAPTVITKQRENCEQQLVNAKEYPTSNGGDGCTVAEEPNTISIKSEPETNDDTDCEEVFPEHSLHDDSLLSVHYDERFEPQMEITEDTQNLVLVPSCQQELTSNVLPYSSEATTCNRVLPVESTSAESLGVIISPDISDNPEQVVHYSSYEPSTIAAHSTSAHDMKTATVMQYEESNDYSVSNQLYQRYSPEQTAFISNEQEGKTTSASLCGNQSSFVNNRDMCDANRKEFQQNVEFQRNFQETSVSSQKIEESCRENTIEDGYNYEKQYHSSAVSSDKSIHYPKFAGTFSPHQNIIMNENMFTCNKCDQTFLVIEDLKKHETLHSEKKRYYGCDSCEKIFKTSTNLKIHKRSHTGEKPYRCDICFRRFTAKCNLTTHRRMHTGEKPYCCPLCSKRFTYCSALIKHRQTHL